MGSMISRRSTSASGSRKSRSSDRLSRLTRTSLYSHSVPGGRIGRARPLSECPSSLLPTSRLWSIVSGLPHSVPCHSLVCWSRWRQVMFRFCAVAKLSSSL